MLESSVSEHGFNLKDARHERGSNRYTFPYPETWYNSQNFANLTVGLRSIILKPDPLQVNLSGFQIVRADTQPLNSVLHINKNSDGSVKSAYDRPGINGVLMYPDRLPIYVDTEVSEGLTMKNICDKVTEACNSTFKDYQDTYKIQAEYYDSKFSNLSEHLEPLQISPGAVNFTYTARREFIMETTHPSKYKFMVKIDNYLDEKDPSTVTNADLSPKDPVDQADPRPINDWVTTAFTDDFEMLLSLRFEEGISLNGLLTGLAGLSGYMKIADAKAACLKYGITFEGVQTILVPLLPEYQKNTDGTYNVKTPIKVQQYAKYVLFTKLVVGQVWSRKDLLIKSSIAELDVNNYLAYSTMTTSSPVCIYASPKMYPIENQSFKFWVDLYDSYNDDLVELPDNVVMIIEAALYINAKPPFNRY